MTIRFAVSAVHGESPECDLVDLVAPGRDEQHGSMTIKVTTKGFFVAGTEVDVSFSTAVTP